MSDAPATQSEELDRDEVPRPVYLRGRIRHGIKWCGVSSLLLVWVWWVIGDWGFSLYVMAFAAFGVFAFSVFLLQAIRPALELRRMGESIF